MCDKVLTHPPRQADKSGVPLDTDKIRQLREKLGLTQQQAAERAGMSGRQDWNRIENGRLADVSISTLERIARALNTTAKDLLK